MLKRHSQLFENLLFTTDLLIIALSWMLSYYLRFRSGLIPVRNGEPDILVYSLMLVPVILIWSFTFKSFGLYRPKRIGSQLSEFMDIAKACVFSALILVTLTFFVRHHEFSRLVFIFFVAFNIVLLSALRLVFRGVLKYLRAMGYNLRYAVIVGTGETAAMTIDRLEVHPEVGIKIEGLISTDGTSGTFRGIDVIGRVDSLKEVIRGRRIDMVFIALPWDGNRRLSEVMRAIGDETVDIKIIPDVFEFRTLGGGYEDFEGLPILNLRNSPLYGWNLIVKRSFDIAVSIAAIAALSPLMLIIALIVKLTSKGPVLYRQERMGIGGDTFQILKFRTMRIGAEASGAVWARPGDPRRTLVGVMLRSTSLDELPQLFNVLAGDMSLVGPRPERPVFIQEFRRYVPRYMLRHKMKAGITGWAQVNGWRGNTDIGRRIEHDLYYIEHWSFALDLKILWLTIRRGFINRNAY